MAVSTVCHRAAHCFFALLVIFLGFVNKCHCHVVADNVLLDNQKDPLLDFVLCRACGADVASSGYIINFLSPEARVISNETLFDVGGVDVQVFVNPAGFVYVTIALSTAGCYPGREKWETINTWYQGYAWKPCYCRQCNRFLGWMFEPVINITPKVQVPTKDGFYLLILSRLISEKFTESLFIAPKHFTNNSLSLWRWTV